MIKIKNKIRLISLLLCCIYLFSFETSASASENTLLNNGSRFTPQFILYLVDQNNTSFELRTGKKISDPDFYTPQGIPFEFTFIYQDQFTGNKYTVSNQQITDTSFGLTTSKKNIRFLSESTIRLIEPDGFIDPDDKIALNLRATGPENKISLDTQNTTLTAEDTDLDWEESDNADILEELNIDLKIEVPLSDGKTVIATIKGNKNGFSFDSGLTKTTTPNSGITATTISNNTISNENIPSELESLSTPSTQTDEDEQNLNRAYDPSFEETSLNGAGLRTPSRSAYQSMSGEKNAVQWIVSLTNFLLNFVTYISMLMLLYGAYLWITATGDEGNVDKAKKIIAGSIIGILLIISAYTIVNTVLNFTPGFDEEYCQANITLSETPEYKAKCKFKNGEISADSSGIGGILGNILKK